MKPIRLLRLAAALALLAQPLVTRAIFGVGDIVFDPTNTAETIKVLAQTQQQVQRLGALLGVSTQQLDQLVQVTNALGNASDAATFARPQSLGQIQSLLHGIPGFEHIDVSKLFNSAGQLDIFMGITFDQWVQAVQRPTDFFRNALVTPAIDRIGHAAGLTQPEIAYAQWYAARAPTDHYNLGGRAAVDFSNLLASRWLEAASERRVNLQALSAATKSAETKASSARTLVEQEHAQVQITAQTNAIALETAAQNADANETTIRAMHAQNRLLEAQSEAQRNADALRLNTGP